MRIGVQVGDTIVALDDLAAAWEDQEQVTEYGTAQSGNFGHKGIPGHRGGSLATTGAAGSVATRDFAAQIKAALDRAVAKTPVAKPVLGEPKTPEPEAEAFNLPTPPEATARRAAQDFDHTAERYAEKLGMPVDQVKIEAQRWLEDVAETGTLKIRAKPSAALAIVASGRFKSQFETGTSGGCLDPELRARAEKNGLGVSGDVPAEKRPIYGYVDAPATAGFGDADTYGSIEFRLKPEVKARATLTVGDSLGGFEAENQVGTPVARPKASEAWDEASISATKGGPAKVEPAYAGYVETQIHGGVTMDDVAEVHFNRDPYSGASQWYPGSKKGVLSAEAALYRNLKADGVKVTGWWETSARESAWSLEWVGDNEIEEYGTASSGNFGHKGIPGHQGGSLSTTGKAASSGRTRKARPAKAEEAPAAAAAPKPKAAPKTKAAPGFKLPMPPARTIEGAERLYSSCIANYAHAVGMTNNELRAETQRWIEEVGENGVLKIRAPAEAAIAIARDGRFKSQFETETSGGSLDTSARATAEENGMGVPDDIPKAQRPIYGYVDAPPATKGLTAVRQYGTIEFRLKPQAKARATMTVGDSLSAFEEGEQAGTPVLKPKASEAWDYGGIEKAPAGVNAKVTPGRVGYIEAQVHGGVKLEDVEEVYFNRDSYAKSQWHPGAKGKAAAASPEAKAYSELTSKGVKVRGWWEEPESAEAGWSLEWVDGDELEEYGTAGSGNWGHAGIKGHRGGSLPTTGAAGSLISKVDPEQGAAMSTITGPTAAARRLEALAKAAGMPPPPPPPELTPGEALRAAILEEEAKASAELAKLTAAEKQARAAYDKANEGFNYMTASKEQHEVRLNAWQDWCGKQREAYLYREGMVQKQREMLYLDDHCTANLSVSGRPKAKEVWNKGIDSFKRMVGEGVADDKTGQLKAIKESRSYFQEDDNTCYMRKSAQEKTVIHELGHWLEANNPEVSRKANAFLEKRTAGEQEQWLGDSYEKQEKGKRDQFSDAYMGKVYYGGATEIMSMGLQEVWTSPAAFARKDPEMFDFVINTARGR